MKTSQKCFIFSLMLLTGTLFGCKENFNYQALESSYFIGSWEWSNAFTPTVTIKRKLIFDANGTGKIASPDGLMLTSDGRLSNFEWVFNKTDSTLVVNQEEYKIIEHRKDYFVWKKGEENSQRVIRK